MQRRTAEQAEPIRPRKSTWPKNSTTYDPIECFNETSSIRGGEAQASEKLDWRPGALGDEGRQGLLPDGASAHRALRRAQAVAVQED